MGSTAGRQVCNNCHGARYIGKHVTDSEGRTWIQTEVCNVCHGEGWQPGGSAS